MIHFRHHSTCVPFLDVTLLTVLSCPFALEAITAHKCGAGKPPLTNLQYYFAVKNRSSHLSLWRHIKVVPQFFEFFQAYYTKILTKESRLFGEFVRGPWPVPIS